MRMVQMPKKRTTRATLCPSASWLRRIALWSDLARFPMKFRAFVPLSLWSPLKESPGDERASVLASWRPCLLGGGGYRPRSLPRSRPPALFQRSSRDLGWVEVNANRDRKSDTVFPPSFVQIFVDGAQLYGRSLWHQVVFRSHSVLIVFELL